MPILAYSFPLGQRNLKGVFYDPGSNDLCSNR
jgi:hypothetical protein